MANNCDYNRRTNDVWTFSSFKRYVDGLFQGLKEQHQQRYEADVQALERALAAANTKSADLEKYLVSRIEAVDKNDDLRHNADWRQMEAFRLALDDRLHSMNEFRKQIQEERGTYVTRALHDRLEGSVRDGDDKLEMSMRHGDDANAKRISELENDRARLYGFAAGAAGVGSLVAMVIAVLLHFLK